MRILHLNEHLNWTGGVETYLLHLIPALEAHGLEQYYAFARGDSSLLANSFEVPELGHFAKRAEQLGYERVRCILDQIKPDVIHVHRVYNLGALRACLDSCPTVVTCHDYLYLCPAGSFFYRRTKTICQRQAGLACFAVTLFKHCLTPKPRYALAYYRRVKTFLQWRERFAKIICPSESVRERLLRVGFPAEKTQTLPYFCPIEPLDEPRPTPPKPTILFVGRIRPIKGYDVFIRALGQLAGVRGILVGDLNGDTSRRINELAKKWDCASRLEVHPWASRGQIPELFKSATIFVFPSVWPETLGIVGLEAMAHGVPVVASDVGGVRQWLRDGVNGALVPPRDATALADAVRRLLNSPESLQRMSQNAIRTIKEGFLLGQHVENLMSLYYQAVNTTVAATIESK